MSSLLQKLNSCKLYRYITYLYDNHILIRYYLRYKLIIIYNYNKETSALDDLLFFRVLEGRVFKFEEGVYRSYLRLKNQVENLGFRFMRMFVFPPINGFDHHGIIDQDLELEDGLHTLFYHRNFRRLHPWIKNFQTGEERHYFEAAEVIEKICTPNQLSFLPVKEGFENRRILYCRRDDVKTSNHIYALPIYSTKRCDIPNCPCYNIGIFAKCDVCGYVMHTCPYTPCKYIYSYKGKNRNFTHLKTHITKYHQKNDKNKLVLIPLEIEELDENNEVEIDEFKMSLESLLKRDNKNYNLKGKNSIWDVFEPYEERQ